MTVFILILASAGLALITYGIFMSKPWRGEHGDEAGMRERALFWSVVIVGVCFVIFAGVNAWFVLWTVQNSQHVWCHVINTLNNPPPTGKVTSSSNPARAYDIKLAQEFLNLKRNLGC